MVKTIQVQDETWRNLTIIKAKGMYMDLDAVIQALLRGDVK